MLEPIVVKTGNGSYRFSAHKLLNCLDHQRGATVTGEFLIPTCQRSSMVKSDGFTRPEL